MQVNGKRKKLQDLHQRSTETQQEQQQINIQLQQLFAQSAEYQQVTQQMQQSGNDCRATWQRGLQTIQLLQPTIQPFAVYQNPLQPPAAETLGRYHHWYTSIYEPLRSKAALLTDWRRELDKPSEQFYPELLRYADVVGATCIGAATAKGLEDLEFHLAIVDEAGQIGITDLLVPLVRAQRAVLVGDHTQLPPFVDSDVQQWLKSSAAPAEDALIENELATLDDWGELDQDQLQELLTKSAFELLFTGQIDPTHLVRFRLQGRMPKIIADFVSQHFYDNMLGTFSSEKMRHTIDQDPLFSNPLTLIDTSNVPDRLRREYKKHGDDDAAESGYTNPGEAQIIVNIAEAYQKTGREWVVIVPYRAQARLIIHELSKRIDSPDIALAERVATVDSFQGGERPKVIYGFTRSNEKGLIGFLKELRRLNVALTRAQQNIILVGNFYMLTRAQNLPFRNLMSGLYAYAQRSGDIWTYERYHRHFGPLR
jgi:superfamily I DNA and/or RNA helicase